MNKEEWRLERLVSVVERFNSHRKEMETDNPLVYELAEKLCGVEINFMWLLTQTN